MTARPTLPTAPIWLVRHGETRWNAERRLQGQMDSPLTETGRRQALAIADLLARVLPRDPAPSLVASPLGRTMATARPIAAALGLEIATDPRIAEVGLGRGEGMTWDEIECGTPGLFDGCAPYERYFRVPDCETCEALYARLADWLAAVDRPTVAVSHGMSGRVLRGLYAGLAVAEALTLPTPQDGVWHLEAGKIAFLRAEVG